MIYKTIPSAGRRGFKKLVDYALQDSKIDWTLFGNLVSERTAAIEMEAVASQNGRVKDAAYHLVISWSPNDKPTHEQIRETVHFTLRELGAEEHQYVAVEHVDAQPHVHLVLNRVHPRTYKSLNLSFDWWRLDALAAQLEARNGWQLAMHSRASAPIEIDGMTWRVGDLLPVRPAPGARRSLAWQGRVSYQEWLAGPVRSDAFEAIRKRGATWTTFHRALAKHGVRFELYGRGAAVVDATNPRYHARAGHVARFATLPSLVARLGPYQPPPKSLVYDASKSYTQTVALAPADRGPADLWRQYQTHAAEMKKMMSASRAQRWKQQRASEKFRRDLIQDDTKDRLKDLRSRSMKIPRKFLRAQLRAQETQRLTKLEAKIKKERTRLRKELNQQMRAPSYRYFLRDLAAKGDVAAMDYLASIQARQRVALTLPALEGEPQLQLAPASLRPHKLRKPDVQPPSPSMTSTPKSRARAQSPLAPPAPRLDL